MKHAIFFATALTTAAVVAVTVTTSSAAPIVVAQNAGTWTYNENGIPKQGYYFISGPHKGTFNPCNSERYISVKPSDVQPYPDSCGSSPLLVPHPYPVNAIGSQPFIGSQPSVNAHVLNVILESPADTQKSLIHKVNSGKITTMDALKGDPLFSNFSTKAKMIST